METFNIKKSEPVPIPFLPNRLKTQFSDSQLRTKNSLHPRSKDRTDDYYVNVRHTLHGVNEKLLVIMVGLPARGKSYISTKLRRYLEWNGYNARVFNVGARRRAVVTSFSDADFFDPNCKQNLDIRNMLAMDVLEDSIKWLKSKEANVAIHDATNSTKERRSQLLARLEKEKYLNVLFIETICTDAKLIESNIRLKLKSPDYKGMGEEKALTDFKKRLIKYESAYETLDDTDDGISYIKLINVSRQVLTNNIRGYLQSQMVTFVMNYHVHPREIWITRHGESEDNVHNLLGGDSSLSPKGICYANALAKFVSLHPQLQKAYVWTSTLARTLQTAKYLKVQRQITSIATLNEIYAGLCEGMTYQQIEENMPEEFEARNKDKIMYRYPQGGESYMDLIKRLKPLIIELERQTDTVLIIGHQAVNRCLLAYFLGISKSDLPHLNVPLHTLFCLTPKPHGCLETRYSISLEDFEKDEDIFWTKQEDLHNW